jgi:hypothetical protein
MKSVLLILLSFFYITDDYGQTTNSYNRITVEIIKKRGEILSEVEVTGFTLSDSSYVDSLKNDINEAIRKTKKVKKGKYTVAVKYIMSKDGYISDIICETDPGFGLCQNVIRVVKKSKGFKWRPLKDNKVREFRTTNQ